MQTTFLRRWTWSSELCHAIIPHGLLAAALWGALGGGASSLAGAEKAPPIEANLDLDAETVRLPEPDREGGMPLMRALTLRRTSREFAPRKPLSAEVLGGLLWAAFGINRPDSGGRTVASAMNAREIDLYVATAEGVFRYEPEAHALRRLKRRDVRPLTGGGAFAKVAPVTLIYVADASRQTRARPEDRRFYAAVTTGGIMQNVYLFAASQGLATVVHELNRPPLARALDLRPDQRIVLAQAVGYPASSDR